MGVEQRGWVKRLHLEFNWKQEETHLSATKSFIIPKQLVVEAFKAVKANAGAARVDRQSNLAISCGRCKAAAAPVRPLAPDGGCVCLMGAV
jgi:hypothetical protein